MLIDPRDLLRKLGGCVRPSGVRADRRGEAFESMGFGALLAEVSSCARTGRPVSIDPAAGGDAPDDVREALSAVADACEAAGLGRVIVVTPDGRALDMDVEARRITGGCADARGLIVRGAGALVVLGGAQETMPRVVDAQELHGTRDANEVRPGDGLRLVRNASLAAVLGGAMNGSAGG